MAGMNHQRGIDREEYKDTSAPTSAHLSRPKVKPKRPSNQGTVVMYATTCYFYRKILGETICW